MAMYTLFSNTPRTYDGHETAFQAEDDTEAATLMRKLTTMEEGSEEYWELVSAHNVWNEMTVHYARREGYSIAVVETRWLDL